MRRPALSRRRIALVSVPVAAVAAAGLGLSVFTSGDASAQDAPDTAATATISRQDLAERETVDGTLGYADRRALVAVTQGTLTRVADEGRTVSRGDVLYRVDTEPVVLMYGAVPVWRTMQQGDEGDDVRQLQRNLRALGHDPDGDMEVDGEFGWATRQAVVRWQEALGVDETGRVDRGQVVFLPTARRMGAAAVPIGGTVRAGTEVSTTTSTARTVTVDLDARRQDLVTEGARERVALPDGRTVTAVVSEVGAVATAGAEGAPATVEVTFTIPDARRISALDQAPVDVEITSETREGVLTVPVTALLALAGGGYGVEVVGDDGATTVLAVEVGTAADGRVEIRGEGIREGARVVVAES